MIAQWRRVDHSNLPSTALDCGMDAPHFLYHMIIGNAPILINCVYTECRASLLHQRVIEIRRILAYNALRIHHDGNYTNP